MECNWENCSQEGGHVGPHGFELFQGLIVMPYGGGEGSLGEEEQTTLRCINCEGGLLSIRRGSIKGGVAVCGICNQRHNFSADGSHSMVLVKLWPQKMKENDHLYREYANWWRKDQLLDNDLRLRLGLQSEKEGLVRSLEIQSKYDQWQEASTKGRRGSWFQRLRSWTFW